uniref:Uncharacterized protein n=1 Tax=Rhizophora mucronata TaxID=61149 RepID=A0A2P2P4C8_RHIMU
MYYYWLQKASPAAKIPRLGCRCSRQTRFRFHSVSTRVTRPWPACSAPI